MIQLLERRIRKMLDRQVLSRADASHVLVIQCCSSQLWSLLKVVVELCNWRGLG